MHRFSKKDILTIPNFLSMIRILLIPVIYVLYHQGQDAWAVWVIALSALTDVVDGKIARRFHMVSDFGKILDPIADKLTQVVMIVCLLERHSQLRPVLILFVLKELAMAISGYIVIQKKNVVNSAKWYGKLSTVVLYGVMMSLILFPGMSETAVTVLCLICCLVMLQSLVQYLMFYGRLLRKAETHEGVR